MVAPERRVKRFTEALTILRGLWQNQPYSFTGEFYELHDPVISMAPRQQPHLPIWIGAGSQPMAAFEESLQVFRNALPSATEGASQFPVSKRVFMVIDGDANRARERLRHWFGVSYGNQSLADTAEGVRIGRDGQRGTRTPDELRRQPSSAKPSG